MLEPSAWLIRQYEPKVLMATGKSEPATDSKRRAFPPRLEAKERSSSLWGCGAGVLETRSAMCGISRIGETGVLMRASSLFFSRNERNSERVSVGMSGDYKG